MNISNTPKPTSQGNAPQDSKRGWAPTGDFVMRIALPRLPKMMVCLVTVGAIVCGGCGSLVASDHEDDSNTGGLSDTSVTAANSYNEGIRLMKAGDKEGAKKKFSESIANETNAKNKADAYTGRGVVQSDGTLALSDYGAALKLSPTSWEAYYNRGQFFGQHKKWDSAIADFSKVIKLAPETSDKAKAYFDRGLTFHHKAQNEQALADLNQALKLNPKAWRPYFERGLIFMERKNLSGAKADFSQAFKLAPENIDQARALHNRSIIESRQRNRAQALVDLNTAIKLDPKESYNFLNRGTLLLDRNDLKGALADFNRSIALNPREPDTYKLRSELYARKRDFARARADVAKCRALGGKPEAIVLRMLAANRGAR